jgi:hypothetical protein
LWISAALAAVATFFCLIVGIYQIERVWPTMLFLFVTIWGIASAPRKLGILSWSAGIPAYYSVFFLALPLVNRLLSQDDPADDPHVALALYVAMAGIVAFIAGRNFMRFLPEPRNYNMLGLLHMRVRGGILFWLIVIGSVSLAWSYLFGYFGLITTTGSEANEAAGAVSAAGFLLTIAHVMAWTTYFRQKRFLVIGLISTILLCSVGMVANSKGQMLAPIMLIALCSWGASGKFPLKPLVAMVFLYMFVAFPFVTASRFAFDSAEFGDSRLDLASIMVDYLLSGRWMDDTAGPAAAVESLGRGLLPYFSDIVQMAGSSVSFMDGRTFIEGVGIMIPRFLYPSKPDMSIGNWTGQAFGAVSLTDDITTVAPTYIGEFYMNFGLLGVCIGMLLIGMLAVLVDRYLIVNRQSWTMPLMVSYIGWQEGFIGHTILPFIKNAVLLVPILILVMFLTSSSATRSEAQTPGR